MQCSRMPIVQQARELLPLLVAVARPRRLAKCSSAISIFLMPLIEGNRPGASGVPLSSLQKERSNMGIFTKDIKSMEDLLIHGLQDIYYAEQQILKALPKMINK